MNCRRRPRDRQLMLLLRRRRSPTVDRNFRRAGGVIVRCCCPRSATSATRTALPRSTGGSRSAGAANRGRTRHRVGAADSLPTWRRSQAASACLGDLVVLAGLCEADAPDGGVTAVGRPSRCQRHMIWLLRKPPGLPRPVTGRWRSRLFLKFNYRRARVLFVRKAGRLAGVIAGTAVFCDSSARFRRSTTSGRLVRPCAAGGLRTAAACADGAASCSRQDRDLEAALALPLGIVKLRLGTPSARLGGGRASNCVGMDEREPPTTPDVSTVTTSLSFALMILIPRRRVRHL